MPPIKELSLEELYKEIESYGFIVQKKDDKSRFYIKDIADKICIIIEVLKNLDVKVEFYNNSVRYNIMKRCNTVNRLNSLLQSVTDITQVKFEKEFDYSYVNCRDSLDTVHYINGNAELRRNDSTGRWKGTPETSIWKNSLPTRKATKHLQVLTKLMIIVNKINKDFSHELSDRIYNFGYDIAVFEGETERRNIIHQKYRDGNNAFSLSLISRNAALKLLETNQDLVDQYFATAPQPIDYV